MSRSSQTEHALRTNAAILLLRERMPIAELVQTLGQRYGVSRRQAYRYIKIAQRQDGGIMIPERKKVFTVKLPLGLIEQIRLKARQTGRSISDIVAEALRYFLSKR